MKSGIFSLRRLRWKLTLSYTLVTVVALLALELILVSALVAFAYSPAPPYLISQWAAINIAPRLEPHLARKKPYTEGLRSALQKSIGVDNGSNNGDPTSGNLFVLGPDRKLLVAEPGQVHSRETFQGGPFPRPEPARYEGSGRQGRPWSPLRERSGKVDVRGGSYPGRR